ncbi:hypothetical protein [Polaribacter butkevichii]|uniref:Uncharacterized protein n=1 Tax=Polaribacter butkevichii TaxID=218490 RepID=A0A2P6C8J6_9FLAO|nr:hypothetical protein [Polaribacter butkevichii]PQJ69249.1 hypothetical protein BTO14_14600 [Polaribacter butkevichii]
MKKKILLLSIGIYIISLTQKSYCTSGGTCEYFSGLLNLIFGWIGVFKFHLPAFPWIANLILLISWKTFYKNTNISFILSILTFLTMLSFLFVDEIIVNDGSTKSKVIFYGFGYWMWLVSSFIMLIGNLIIYKKEKLI